MLRTFALGALSSTLILAAGCGSTSSSNDSAGNVLNVNALWLNGSTAKSYTTDHSKVAITAAPPWVCVGDINRMASQAARGGGAVCFDHAPALWAMMWMRSALVPRARCPSSCRSPRMHEIAVFLSAS